MTHPIQIALLAGAALSLASPAKAQAICAPREAVLAQLFETYGETRRGVGLAANNAMVELYASEDTGTWTIVVTSPGGLSCLVASGQAWSTVTDAAVPEGDPL